MKLPVYSGFLISLLITPGCQASEHPEQKTVTTYSTLEPELTGSMPAAKQVSTDCLRAVQVLKRNGAIRPAEVTADGAIIHVDRRWAQMDFALQKDTARCLSNYLAGGQDRWIIKVKFVNQVTGVTYGTLRGQRYSTGP